MKKVKPPFVPTVVSLWLQSAGTNTPSSTFVFYYIVVVNNRITITLSYQYCFNAQFLSLNFMHSEFLFNLIPFILVLQSIFK